MNLSKQIRGALNDVRTLMLGTQILLGFQFREIFSEGFDGLAYSSRYLSLIALALLIITTSLLIMPGPFHRIVERGQDTDKIGRLVTAAANFSLLPLALALALDLFIVPAHIAGADVGRIIGLITGISALLLWYAVPLMRKKKAIKSGRFMKSKHSDTQHHTPLPARIEQMLTEARVILPGAQALFGFQLAIVLTDSFDVLPEISKSIHLASLCAIALAVVLLITPAIYHRIAYDGEDSEEIYDLGSLILTLSSFPLALGIAGDVYVVVEKVLGSQPAGLAASVIALTFMTGLWFAYPLVVAKTNKKIIIDNETNF